MSVMAFGNIPFFHGLDPTQAENYARGCVWKRFQEHELVLDFDDRSTDVYFIVSGEVRVLVRTAAGREMIFDDLDVASVLEKWRRSTDGGVPPMSRR